MSFQNSLLLYLSFLIALASLMVSVYIAFNTNWSKNIETRRASRESHTRMLFDIDLMYIEFPDLWSIYDSHPLAKEKDISPVMVAKREGFIYQHFDFFEMIRDYYEYVIYTKGVDKEYWVAWEGFISHFIEDSSEARELFKQQRTQGVYSVSFTQYINDLIDKRESKQTQIT